MPLNSFEKKYNKYKQKYIKLKIHLGGQPVSAP